MRERSPLPMAPCTMLDDDEFDPLDDEADEATGPDGLLRDDIKAQLEGAGHGNAAVLAEAARMGGLHLAGLADAVRQVEGLLQLVDRALRVSQPPVPGKIGVRWWRLRGRDAMRMPVLVTWHPVHGGRRWRARLLKQVRRDRINRKGSAELCADETYDLARAAFQLIREYGRLRTELTGELRRLKASHESTTDGLGQIRSMVLFSHAATVKKLLNAGYEVDQATVDLPETYLVE